MHGNNGVHEMDENVQMRRRNANEVGEDVLPIHATVEQGIRGRSQLAHRSKWQRLGAFGFVLVLASIISVSILAYVERWGVFNILDPGGNSKSSISSLPPFFDGKSIPEVLSNYPSMHQAMHANPFRSSSKFLVYELHSSNTTLLSDSFLGLTSAFLLAILTDRALMVTWEPDTAGSPNDTSQLNQLPIDAILQNPGFEWNYNRFIRQLQSTHAYSKNADIWVPTLLDVPKDYDALACDDLQTTFSQKVIRISTTEYFAPLLMVNPYFSRTIEVQFGSGEMFEYLFNFLVRPPPSVFTAIRRFKERYFDGNEVISVQMELHESNHEIMTTEHQKLFFQTASTASDQAAHSVEHTSGDGGVMMFVVTDDQPLLMNELQSMRQTSFGSAGLVAVTGLGSPSSMPMTPKRIAPPLSTSLAAAIAARSAIAMPAVRYPARDLSVRRLRKHTTSLRESVDISDDSLLLRVYTELQQLWLLGEASTIITTPGSVFGILGHARVGVDPIVVIDDKIAHQSTSSQPCLADFGVIQRTQCFRPSMLSLFAWDPMVPC